MENKLEHEGYLILDKLRSGDNDAFAVMYHKYYDRVLYFLRRYVAEWDAQDLAADTFLQLWRKKEDFYKETDLARFLFVTARNKCYDLLRYKKVRIEHADELKALMNESQEDGFYSTEIRIEFLKLLEGQLNQLPEKMREVFILAFRDGLKPAEIAAKLGISSKTVSNQKLTAIKLLRDALKGSELIGLLFFLESTV
ncbi:MAG: RNA polymerase sigma factor [Chitinophagaceae bacterium]